MSHETTPPVPDQPAKSSTEWVDELPAAVISWLTLTVAVLWGLAIVGGNAAESGLWWLALCAFLLARILVALQQIRAKILHGTSA